MPGMNRRTISSIISKKVDAWIATLPEELAKGMKDKVVVTGGSIASMLLGENVNDYDIYFEDLTTAEKIAKHYVYVFQQHRAAKANGVKVTMHTEIVNDSRDQPWLRVVVKSAGVAGEKEPAYEYTERDAASQTESAGEYLSDVFGDVELAEGGVDEEAREQKPLYHPVFLSTNAITLKGDIQLVLRFQGDPDQIHKNFDFVHCTNYWTNKEGLVLRVEALESLMSKTLRYTGSLFPVCSIFRSKKFIQRGWSINAGQYLKMALQISELDLLNPAILQEQLTGVDVAYFNELLDKTKPTAVDEHGNPTYETAYLVEVINRMF